MKTTYRTFFCDDLRGEAGNKESYMGVVDDNIQIDAPLPAILPKLVCVVLFDTDAKEKFEEEVHLSYNNNHLHTQKISVARTHKVGSTWKGRINLVFSPFLAESDGELKVSVGKKAEHIGSLQITGPIKN